MILLSKTLQTLASVAGVALIVTQPAWGLLQLTGYGVLGASLWRLLSPLDAFLAVTMGLALQGSDSSAEGAFRKVLLPLWAMLACGGLLACVVFRHPRLGQKIEHGPFGPGGASGF